ncbi:MAG: DNA recombination protein RmuC [Acidobacteria bacterium]|jgi:DNA recombination protein RmuC|nr:DNA recombination protein RmuC [Acidobacteriota bacterium]
METVLFIVLLAVAVVLLLAVLALQLRPRDASLNQQMLDLKNQVQELKTEQLQAQNKALMQQSGQLNEIMRTVNETLSKGQGSISSQLRVVGEIQQKLGLLEESTNQMKAIGKDISSLQDILRAPKLRGNLGEYLLEDLLRQVLPAGNFTLQYAFPDGAKVDAVITLGERLIPVDAKFPLESFVRLFDAGDEEGRKKHRKEFVKSFKLRVDEIAAKYIRPECGTYDFALVYIPAENVFYEAVISDGLDGRNYGIFNYAVEKHVIPVSPNSFYAYLMAIAFGLKGLKIEQQTRQILKDLVKVQESFAQFYGDFCLLGKHLGYAAGKYDETAKKAEKFQDRLADFTGARGELHVPEDKVPGLDE